MVLQTVTSSFSMSCEKSAYYLSGSSSSIPGIFGGFLYFFAFLTVFAAFCFAVTTVTTYSTKSVKYNTNQCYRAVTVEKNSEKMGFAVTTLLQTVTLLSQPLSQVLSQLNDYKNQRVIYGCDS